MHPSMLNIFESFTRARQRYVCAAALCLAIAPYTVAAAEPVHIPMTADRWTTVLGSVKFVEHMGKPSIELKDGDYKKGIPSGLASLKDLQFGSGTIQYGRPRLICRSHSRAGRSQRTVT